MAGGRIKGITIELNGDSSKLEASLNYLEVGYFTEVIFPQYGVRFIAIDSAVDSADQTSTEYAPTAPA